MASVIGTHLPSSNPRVRARNRTVATSQPCTGTSGGQPPGPPMVLWRGAVLANRYPKMAARRERRGVLAVTTSARSSAMLHSKNRQLGKEFEVTAMGTTSGVDSTRPPVDPAAAGTRSLLDYGVLAGACYLVVELAQARTRDGYDLTRHDQSLLANGPYGWAGSRAPTSS